MSANLNSNSNPRASYPNVSPTSMNQSKFSNLKEMEKVNDENEEDRKFNVTPTSISTSTTSNNITNIGNTVTNQNDALARPARVSQRQEAAPRTQEQAQVNQPMQPTRRAPSVEINPLKMRRLRKFMELAKEPFEAFRMSDAPVIDAMLRCAEIDVEKLRVHLINAFTKPTYLPDEDEVFELNPTNIIEEQDTDRSNDRNNRRPRNFQVTLSVPAYRLLLGIQTELSDKMTWQPDINAVANGILDTAKHYRRQVVLGIAQSFEDLQKKP